MTELRLDYLGHAPAATACRRWHYSRTLPTPPMIRVGVWEDGSFVGAVIFSRGNSNGIADPFGMAQTEVVELARIALRAHVTPVTRIVKVALGLLRRRSPGLRLVVSYADPAQGHLGVIYQAGGWTFLGQRPAGVLYRDRGGRVWHSRMTSPSGWKVQYGERRRVVRPQDCERIDTPGKYKYALGLDRQARALLVEMAQPPPRKLDSAQLAPEA